MGFTELCIRRPVFATVLSLVLVLAGLMSFSRLTIREYPNIDEPQVSVQTNYPGASAEIIEIAGDAGAGRLARRHRGHRHHRIDVARRIRAASPSASAPPSTSMRRPATCATG